jgi:hypothetical protein
MPQKIETLTGAGCTLCLKVSLDKNRGLQGLRAARPHIVDAGCGYQTPWKQTPAQQMPVVFWNFFTPQFLQEELRYRISEAPSRDIQTLPVQAGYALNAALEFE